MIETLLKQDSGLFDCLNPVSPDFCIYWKPNGELLTYGWNFDGAPKKGTSMNKMESPGHEVWVESKEGPYFISDVKTFERPNAEENPDGVQRIHWIMLQASDAMPF